MINALKNVPKRLIKNFEISRTDIVSINRDPLNDGGFEIFFINSELWRKIMLYIIIRK